MFWRLSNANALFCSSLHAVLFAVICTSLQFFAFILYRVLQNKLASLVDAIPDTEIWNNLPPTHSMQWLTGVGAKNSVSNMYTDDRSIHNTAKGADRVVAWDLGKSMSLTSPNLKCVMRPFEIEQRKSRIGVAQSWMFMPCDRIRWEGWLGLERENIVDLSSFYPQHVTTAQCRKYLWCLWPMQISSLQTWTKLSFSWNLSQVSPSKSSDVAADASMRLMMMGCLLSTVYEPLKESKAVFPMQYM